MSITKVLLISTVWPEPRSSAAGVRDRWLLETFVAAGWETWCVSPSKDNEYKTELERMGVKTWACPPNDARFDEFMTRERPDVVVFDRFIMEEQFGWRVAQACPGAVRVLDTQDLHFLRRARQAGSTLQTNDMLRECGAIFRSDRALVLSLYEMELLTRELGIPPERLMYLPFAYPSAPQASGFEERAGFVFIGNFRHPPNHDAVFWLAQEIWPQIRARLPQAELHVYGAYPPQEAMALHAPERGFYVKGQADDACRTLARYRVNLAPLRFGAGIKGKITDGWWAGTPAVATPIGAEGLCGELEFGGLVADGATAFAAAAVRLDQDQDVWERAQKTGRIVLTELHDAAKNSKRLISEIQTLQATLQELRLKNLTGRILQHAHYRSTEYFSRWIELKERTALTE